MKRAIALTLAFLALSVFVFGSMAFAKNVTLNYWMWDPQLSDEVHKLIAKFESQNPGVKIELTAMAPKDYWTKIRIAASTKKLPDVFNMSSGYLEEWAQKGFLKDLTDYVNKDIDPNKYFINLFDAGKAISGTDKYYAVPFALVTTVLFFNKDMFDEAGLEYPNSNWTWDDFLKAAKALTKDKDGDGKIDQWGYWFYGRYANIEPWIYRNSGYLINRKKMRFEPNENAMDAIKFLISLVKEHKVAPEPKLMSGIRAKDVFPRGLAAMWIDGSWNIRNCRKVIGDKFRWGIAEVPMGPHKAPDVAFGWPDFIAMSKFTKHTDIAWKFIKFASGEGLSLDMYMAGKIPSYKPLTLSEAFLEKGKQPAEKGLLVKMAAKKMLNSFTKGWSEWRGYGGAEKMGLNGALDSILNGESFDKVWPKAVEYINKVLARYYK